MMKKIVVLVLVLAVIFAISSSADVDTGFSCSLGCESLSQNGESYYCNQDTQTCFLLETPIEPAAPNTTAATAAAPPVLTTEEKVATLEQNIASLQQSLAEVNLGISLSSQDISEIKNQLAGLQAELATLKGSIQNDLNTQTNSLATGLAGLQEGINKTQQALETINERQSLTRFLTITFLILVIAGVGGGMYYYVNRGKKTIGPEALNYINNRIKQGKKLPQIRQELRKAGWTDNEIEKAYHETAQQNYRQYKSVQPAERADASAQAEPRPVSRTSVQASASNLPYDSKKMIIIAVISILVITGALLALRASTGQAIFFKKFIGGQENGTSGENTYKVECTPPHLLNPTEDACCLDSDNSGVCDTTELQGAGLDAGGECNDNRECKLGLYCIANKCTTLQSLYTGEGDCTKLCNYYAIKMLTSDGEKYDLKPKQGSYTGAGALEWKILEMPPYCKGETAIVPINIIKKQTGKKISEEVILLHEGEKSPVLTHPTIPQIAFTLTTDKVFESCPK